jgi:hypothetical protein
MRGVFIILGMLFWPRAVAAEAPFSPVPNAADYVATRVEAAATAMGLEPAENIISSVAHHAGWTRAQYGERSTRYFNDAGTVSVVVDRAASGEYAHLTIDRETQLQKAAGSSRGGFKTGERQTRLGESCAVLEIWRWSPWKVPAEFSCITGDGIALWNRTLYEDGFVKRSVEVTSIERRPVQPSQVRPPEDLLELTSWISPAERQSTTAVTSAAPHDFETVMRDHGAIRTTRRHHPWTSMENFRDEGVRSWSIVNEVSGLHIDFEADPGGDFRKLTIFKGARSLFQGFGTPKDVGIHETVLGEVCTWFDLWPGVADGGLAQCRTPDGIVLKEEERSYGGPFKSIAAHQLHRRPVALTDVLPSDILNPENWGIQNGP